VKLYWPIVVVASYTHLTPLLAWRVWTTDERLTTRTGVVTEAAGDSG